MLRASPRWLNRLQRGVREVGLKACDDTSSPELTGIVLSHLDDSSINSQATKSWS